MSKRAAFARLHESGCFVIPNPWDPGSARALSQLGFKALATTSAGFAFSRGLPDTGLTLDQALAHAADIVDSADLPVSCDFQNAYADSPEQAALHVARCAATGVAGLSVEDAIGPKLYDFTLAVERIAAARQALTGTGVLLTARAECFLTRHPDPLNESIRRLRAYADAGADVLYAPGPRRREEIAAIVEAVHPKPVNVLMGWNDGLTVADLAALGARRISVGSSLARTAWTAFLKAATGIASEGSFAGFDGLKPFAEIDAMFR